MMTADDRRITEPYFWDVNWHELDIRKHRRFIIERLLQFGRPVQIQWVLHAYGREDIVDTIKCSRTIDRRTANYWALHYAIPKENVLCLNRQLTMPYFS